MATTALFESLGSRGDVCRLGPLGPGTRFEFDLGTLGETFVAIAGDAAVMDEEILRIVVRGNEAITFGIIEPFDCSATHVNTS